MISVQGSVDPQGLQSDKGPVGDKAEVVQTLLDGLKDDDVKQQFKVALGVSTN